MQESNEPGNRTVKTVMKRAVLDAPSNLGLRPPRPGHLPGVFLLPKSLRAKGLLEKLNAEDAGEVKPPEYSEQPDYQTGFRNGLKIAAYSEALADKIAHLINNQYFPIVLGGDCSILLGSMLALRSLGSYGLCFLDGHDDFAYPRSSKWQGLYTAAGRDLALVTGYGPEDLVNIRGLLPYVNPSNVVALGFYHDPVDEAEYATEAIYQTPIKVIDIHQIRAIGVQEAAHRALEHLKAADIQGFWIHLDADVLDQSVMPCVDSPNPNGLMFDELREILTLLLGSKLAVGMQVTIFDPELDPDGKYASALVETIAQAFAS